MSAVPPSTGRGAIAKPGKDGKPEVDWTLTPSSIADTVKIAIGPFNVLPVVFVPGIMGSNLKSLSGEAVWRLDANYIPLVGDKPIKLAGRMIGKGEGKRQRLLHPARCVVDNGGSVPDKSVGTAHGAADFTARGWGEVGEGSYHEFLLWLEEKLNPLEGNPALWPDFFQSEATIGPVPQPGEKPKLPRGIRMGVKGEPFHSEKAPFKSLLTDDLLARAKFLMPVYAVGYNWLDSNEVAATELKKRILRIIAENNKGMYRCQQVVLLTHSMGGLVGRACAKLSDMDRLIAGVVHGVMPTTGAAVAYRRCKIGMKDEDGATAVVIGRTGQEVTAVFAQAPGALQLLPTQKYNPGWLKVSEGGGKPLDAWPKAGGSPYADIYLERSKWWGLVNEAWLAPAGGVPIKWKDFVDNVKSARDFHADLGTHYHPTTYVFYGAEDKTKTSFETVTWRLKEGAMPPGERRPAAAGMLNLDHSQIRNEGVNPAYIGGQLVAEVDPFSESMATHEESYWELHCDMQDGAGDGTVPKSSGCKPLSDGGGAVQQQFKLKGIDHEGAYKDGTARMATLYAVTAIAGQAKVPA